MLRITIALALFGCVIQISTADMVVTFTPTGGVPVSKTFADSVAHTVSCSNKAKDGRVVLWETFQSEFPGLDPRKDLEDNGSWSVTVNGNPCTKEFFITKNRYGLEEKISKGVNLGTINATPEQLLYRGVETGVHYVFATWAR